MPPDVNEPEDRRPPMAIAMEWVSRITTIALEMVLPGLLGLWIDNQLGTRVVFMLLGFGVGMTVAIWHLSHLAPARRSRRNGREDPRSPP
jgi:hypothetical protein